MFKKDKYRTFPKVHIEDRIWPNSVIEKAPQWCSVDLRDGNQALIKPMDMEKKLEFFNLLVKVGFKTIEIGFPSASQVEFDFTRRLIEENRVPDDVKIQVFTQAREHLIETTRRSLEGAKNVVVHLYNSTSKFQREVVFQKDKEAIKEVAVAGANMIKNYFADFQGNLQLEYSPESFTQTELEYAKEICNAVLHTWRDFTKEKIIINLPATVEVATPNIYADQIEWMCRNLAFRDEILVSVHTHNDRGTAVAATEFALMAGVDRVEGTLLGNGERTGNVDIMTVALNMYTQGVDPKLDFTNINELLKTIEKCTEIDTHIRHPYAGKMVYTAFSGSHQDAISKAMAYQQKREDGYWEVPYLPIDPADLGRTYEDLIRINSQSGKGGVAFILEQKFHYEIPKKMHPVIGNLIQKEADKRGDVLSDKEILKTFEQHFFKSSVDFVVESISSTTNSVKNETKVDVTIRYKERVYKKSSLSSGPVSAMCEILSEIVEKKIEVIEYHEHSLDVGNDANAVAYVGVKIGEGVYFGIGKNQNITLASMYALVNAVDNI